MEYTLSYASNVQGWVSFYSFYPDYMIGMNQYFYTFKNGNLYRHNVNSQRNTFYGTFTPSTLTSVFNISPLENKIFKTLNLEGDAAWDATLQTDIQDSGYILNNWFEKKEASFYAFVRNNSSGQLKQRSVNGIGKTVSVNSTTPSAVELNFSISPLVAIGSIISVGDLVYYAVAPYTVNILSGEVVAINQNYPLGVNQLVIDTTITGGSIPPGQTDYIMFIKNSVAESHGVLGHYCVFELTNSSTDKIELFAAESNVMKSFP
jgi:hypothetical protein